MTTKSLLLACSIGVALATGVIGTHVGTGAWAVFYQVEDAA